MGNVDFACLALISLICSIFCVLIRYINCIKDQQMHFNFTDVFLLYYGHQHVLAIYVPIFMVTSLRKRIQL